MFCSLMWGGSSHTPRHARVCFIKSTDLSNPDTACSMCVLHLHENEDEFTHTKQHTLRENTPTGHTWAQKKSWGRGWGREWTGVCIHHGERAIQFCALPRLRDRDREEPWK